jgi:hypothetical protein
MLPPTSVPAALPDEACFDSGKHSCINRIGSIVTDLRDRTKAVIRFDAACAHACQDVSSCHMCMAMWGHAGPAPHTATNNAPLS